MNKKDLDALSQLYASLYENQLNELSFGDLIPRVPGVGMKPGEAERIYRQARAERAKNQRAQLGVVKTNRGYVAKPGATSYDAQKSAEAIRLASRLNKETGLGKQKPAEAPKPTGTPAGSPPRPAAASGPVLSKKNGVEGTGVGANFKARAFTAAEKSRYASVAAKNAARTSASSGAATPAAAQPKPPTPAVGKLGSTSFERRTPTSAELRAAQAERATQKASGQDTSSVKNAEKALQAAQRTNLPTTGPSVDLATAKTSIESDKAKFTPRDMNKYPIKTPNPINNTKPSQTMKSSYEWPSAKTIKDIADAYASIYEGKKKDQDGDKDKDFADVMIARMMASGMSRAEAIAAVRNKEYNEEFVTEDPVQDFRDMRRAKENAAGLRGSELSNSARPAGSAAQKPQPRSREFEKVLPSGSKPKPSGGGSAAMRTTGPSSPGYDTRRLGGSDLRRLSNSYEFEGSMVDEATRMRKELGKEGETRVRGELAARSRAFKRSGSVDKTIAAAERGANRPYVKFKRNESDADRKKREEKQSRTLRGLASSRRGSVRDRPRVELRGYAAKVEGSDKDLQSARSSAMSAGTLTPKEKKQLGEEYTIYEIVASYLLENNFAETLNDANIIIENMSENWVGEILEAKKPLPVSKMKKKESKLLDNEEGQLKALRTDVGSKERKARMKELQRFDNINSVRTSVAKRGGKEQHPMPEIGRYKPKDED